jgi:hypothetical protein
MATNFKFFQLMIDDAKYHEVNSKGWGEVAWGDAYTALTAFPREDNVWLNEKITKALAHDLYQLTALVQCEAYDPEDALEAIFCVTNGMSSAQAQVLDLTDQRKSGSVGDVAIDYVSHRGWMCMSCGWFELDQEHVSLILDLAKEPA